MNYLYLLSAVCVVLSIYVPENGDDWTLLKPSVSAGGIETLPYNFGIAVTYYDDDSPTLDTTQIDDGQVQRWPQSGADVEAVPDSSLNAEAIRAVSCQSESTLSMSLTGGILRDSNNRIGTIVSSRQFQFDGPTPQYGSVYANGWSVNSEGYLTLGDQDVFYQCASGDFYNLYDQSIDAECDPVRLRVVGLVDC